MAKGTAGSSSQRGRHPIAILAKVLSAIMIACHVLAPCPAQARNGTSVAGDWHAHVVCINHKQYDFEVSIDDSNPQNATAILKGSTPGANVVLVGYINYYLGIMQLRAENPNKTPLGYPSELSGRINGESVSGVMSIRGSDCGASPYKLSRAQFVPPELRKGPVALPALMGPLEQRYYEFAYHTPAQSDSGTNNFGIEPIDEINQWLLDEGFKCIASKALTLTKGAGRATAAMPQFGKKRYVLYCDKTCDGLRYTLRPHGAVLHWGVSEPYPVLQIDGGIGSTNADFGFAWNDLPSNATLTLSEWSNDPGDHGGGCGSTMFQGR